MMVEKFLTAAPSLEEISSSKGYLLLEFGTDWCGHCRAAELPLEEALKEVPAIKLIKIEDGAGRKLGRHFKVKLWPTFILLKDGDALGSLVRPREKEEFLRFLALLHKE